MRWDEYFRKRSIEFEIEKNTKPDPNIHRLKLYNLAPETIEAVSKPDGFCVLYAGYAEDEGEVLMAAGGGVDAYTYREGTERITELSVADGWVELRDTAVSLGFGAGGAHSIIREIAKQMNLSLMIDEKLPNRVWQHGFSFYGAARRALDKVVAGWNGLCKTKRCKWCRRCNRPNTRRWCWRQI